MVKSLGRWIKANLCTTTKKTPRKICAYISAHYKRHEINENKSLF